MTQSAEDVLKELVGRCATLRLEHANEAKTRLEVVDRILEDVLGWPREQFNPEMPVAGTKGKVREWLDYHLTTTEGPSLVVEAKRLGTTFNFSTTKRQRTYRLQSLRNTHGSALTAVVAQATKYCMQSGTFPFVVTNGVQWIAGVTAWPGVPADKLEAVVFHDLDDVLGNLPEFLDLLSPHGLVAGEVIVRAVQTRGMSPVSAQSLNGKVPHNPPPRSVNYLVRPIESLMRLCFDELSAAKSEEMLRLCYVRNDLTEGYVARLETFVGDTLTYDLDPQSTKTLDRAHFARDPAQDPFTRSISSEGEALLLVGRVGTGKSTFIEYATLRLREAFTGRSLVLLRLDLRMQTQLTARQFDHDKLRTEVATSLLEQAANVYRDLSPFEYENLKGIFSAEVQRELSAMPPKQRDQPEAEARANEVLTKLRADPFLHLKRYLAYLRSNRRIPATVIFDNIDRGSIEFERAVFSFARNISTETGVSTLTALRDTTYHNEKTLGFLDVSQNVVFTVSPPAFASVLSRRLDYAKQKVFADDATAKRLLRTMEGFSIDSVKGFIEVMSEILGGSNMDIRDCIQALAATDIRRCLELLRQFCTSPNTDIERMMKEYNKGYFKQPLAVLLRSLMCGSVTRYVERTSAIYNLFQVPESHVDSHFVSLRVLQFLDAAHRDSRSDTDIPAKQLVATLSSAGFTPSSVKGAIDRMGERRLLISRSHPEPPWDDTTILRLGGSGKYYLDTLVYEFEYIKNVVDDTVLYDANISATLLALQKDRDIAWPQKNDSKMRVFVEHLLRTEKKELSTIPDARARLPWCAPIMPVVGERLFGARFVHDRGGRRRSS